MNIVYRIFELQEVWVDEDLITAFQDWGKEFTTEEETLDFIRRSALDNLHPPRELIIRKIIRI